MKIGDHVLIGGMEEQKTWIDTIDPIAACSNVYADFVPGTGVHRKTALLPTGSRTTYMCPPTGRSGRAWKSSTSGAPDWTCPSEM